MAAPNPLREQLTAGKFCYVVELVASRLTREARLLEAASQLAQVPGVVAGSITSYAGGALGHDPIRVGTAARARGLTPNIHLTCVNRDRAAIQRGLEDLHSLGIENVFAITGDYPKIAIGDKPPFFGLDSVQLIEMISEMRQAGIPFWIGAAVSPFKYTEADCMYQYLKLEKKIAAGANYAVTQVGFDSRKFAELKNYLKQRNLNIPMLGNVYVLQAKAAEKMSKGEPPGCWVAPELLKKIQEEVQSADKGQAARLERAARMVAVLRGLGYAGAYLGGDHRADHVKWIIRRSEALGATWETLAEELNYAPKKGFYRDASLASAVPKRKFVPRMLDNLAAIFPVNRPGRLRTALATAFRGIDRWPLLGRGVERVEFALKAPLFGCQACGNCVLGSMEYVCPQTCPKNLRNGPCGGTNLGRCEVVDKPCIWVEVYERAKTVQRVDELRMYIPPRNTALQGTSSWINYFLERDTRPGKTVQLYQPIAAAPRGGGQTKNSTLGKPGESSTAQPPAPLAQGQTDRK
jgi:methylenetetrahydrofolate reductase (NADPH)